MGWFFKFAPISEKANLIDALIENCGSLFTSGFYKLLGGGNAI
jgi:hypothetical protein